LPDAELDALLVERNRRVLEAELARRNMAAFVSFTKRDYCHNRFSRAVCEALDLFLEDGETPDPHPSGPASAREKRARLPAVSGLRLRAFPFFADSGLFVRVGPCP